MPRPPLSDEFDMPIDENELEEYVKVVIPDDPKLKTIVDFAMDAYASQMNDLQHIEVKNRLKFYEVAERFLNQAKDAMYKIEQIEIEREKLKARARGASKDKSPSGGTGGESTGIGRSQLNAKVQQLREVK